MTEPTRASSGALLDRPVRVAALWNGAVQWEELVTTARPVELGAQAGALCPVPEGFGDAPSLTLLEPREGGLMLRIAPGMGGDVFLQGHRRAVRRMGAGSTVPLNRGDYGLVTIGPVAVFFQPVEQADPLPRRFWTGDRSFAAVVLLAAALCAVALVSLFVVARSMPPGDDYELPVDLVTRYLITPPPTEVLEERVEREEPEKKLEKREKPKPEKVQPRIEMPKSVNRQVQKMQEERTGSSLERLAQALKTSTVTASDFSNLAKAGPIAGPSTISQALNSLGSVPSTVSVQTGGGGDIGTLGGSAAVKGVQRLQAQGGPVRGKVRAVTALARVQGSLDRGQVLEVINRAINRIQRCYESALGRNPNLAGQIAFTWTIDTRGRVSNATQSSSTISDAQVSNCIAGILRSLTFPQPQGGPVTVSYPFIFQRAP